MSVKVKQEELGKRETYKQGARTERRKGNTGRNGAKMARKAGEKFRREALK